MATYKPPKLLFIFYILIIIIIIITTPSYTTNVNAAPHKRPFKYMFQFGDSLSDTGNFIRYNLMTANSPYSRLPYGQTLGFPTGRCSDGLLMVDYFTNYFRLPHLNPYLDKQANFSHGVNFAMGGATAVDNSTLWRIGVTPPHTSISLSVQLNWFKSHLHSLCGGSDSGCKRRVLRNSLILMGEVGGGDYNTALLEGYYQLQVGSDLVPYVVNSIRDGVKQVIEMGATRVVVPGVLPLGCLPVYLSYYPPTDPTYDEFKCLKDVNDLAKLHNDELQKAIKVLQREHPGVAIVYADYYSAYMQIFKKADTLGFDRDNVLNECCGANPFTYNDNLMTMCGNDQVVCGRPDQYLSWDGIHLTQHAYFRMAQFLLRQIVPQMFKSSPAV